MNTASPDHNPVLDGVRGLAIVLVLLWHFFYLTPDSSFSLMFNHIAGLGWLGVDLFFVLSGYLITRILIATRNRSGYFSRFYIRRAFRIFPAYYAVLALIWFVLPASTPLLRNSNVLEQWPYFAGYLQNWGMSFDSRSYDWPGVHHLWSLAIEEQFYLLWPFLVAAVAPQHLGRLCLMLIVGSVLGKFALAATHVSWTALYMATPCRLEGLAYGAFIATLTPSMLRDYRPWIAAAGWAGAAGMIVLLVSGASMTSRLTLAWAIPAATALFGWLILATHQHTLPAPIRTVLSGSLLTWFGKYSYGIYLCHYVIYWCVRPLMIEQAGLSLDSALPNAVALKIGAASLLLSLVFARTMYALIESPALRLRDYLDIRASRAQEHRNFSPHPRPQEQADILGTTRTQDPEFHKQGEDMHTHQRPGSSANRRLID